MTESNLIPEPLADFTRLANSTLPLLQEIDLLRAQYHSRLSTGGIAGNLIEALRIEQTYNSNAIEGSTLTLRQTQLAVEGTVPPGATSIRELYEARNHDLALRLIEKWAMHQGQSLTENALLQLHARVMTDIAAYAGQFRSNRVLIAGSGFIPPDSRKFETLIPTMLALASRPSMHPVLIAAELHYNLVAIHPFNDGNGRTARLLMDLHLLKAGFPHTIIAVADRAEYLATLDEANHGKLQAFATFIMNSLKKSILRYLI